MAGTFHKGWWWAALLLGSFIAGLGVVGFVQVEPGVDSPTPGPSVTQSPSGTAPSNTPASAAPASPLINNGSSPFGGASIAPRIAVVVDDFGYDPGRDVEWIGFPGKVTFSILPFGPSSRRTADSARERGVPVILHAPMEPEAIVSDRTDSFRFVRGMARADIVALLARMAESVPGAVGVSNHMGSAFTSDENSMLMFSSALKERGLFFLDSLTTPKSVAGDAAQSVGIPFLRRTVFLDEDPAPAAMAKEWERAVAVAKAEGKAVVVGHSRPATRAFLLERFPAMAGEGIVAVTIPELLDGIAR